MLYMGKYLNLRQGIALGLTFAFLANTLGPIPIAQAQEFCLPAPGIRVGLSPGFNPPILKGIKVHPHNPFRFDFILDQGDNSLPLAGRVREGDLKQQATKLIKYFLASLTIPEKDLWVNLSPYEKNRIVPESFGQTEMGRDLLAEDYMLKQITASLIYPEDEIGKKFWKRIYEESAKKFGTTNIPVNTFNKVWIVPDKAVVYENAKAGTAYVVEAKLKVMLEQDYLALSHSVISTSSSVIPAKAGIQDTSALGSQIVREIVIPELTKEVNEGKNFSQLRQVYNSLILATWYKKKIKDSILAQVYADKSKVAGVQYENSVIARSEATKQSFSTNDVESIYQQYLQAFKKGAYNYIKEELDPITQLTIPRKYFSGGFGFVDIAMHTEIESMKPPIYKNISQLEDLTIDMAMASAGKPIDRAMASGMKEKLAQFWSKERKELDITEFIKSRLKSGTFSRRFRFEGNGFQPGWVSMGIGHGKEGDRVVMKWTEDGEIVFERRRADKMVASVVWVRGEKQDKYGHAIWENKGNPLLWPFWKHAVDEVDITEELRSRSTDGTFNAGFKFEAVGYQPGIMAIGIGHGEKDDRVIMRWVGDGEIVFERRRAGKMLPPNVVWVKGEKKDKEGHAIWENKGDPLLWPFWKHAVDKVDITEELGQGMLKGQFNVAFRFEGDGYQPGVVAIGIGHGKKGDRVVMEWTEKGVIVFDRLREKKVVAEAMWIRDQEDENGYAEWHKGVFEYSLYGIFEFLKKQRNPVTIRTIVNHLSNIEGESVDKMVVWKYVYEVLRELGLVTVTDDQRIVFREIAKKNYSVIAPVLKSFDKTKVIADEVKRLREDISFALEEAKSALPAGNDKNQAMVSAGKPMQDEDIKEGRTVISNDGKISGTIDKVVDEMRVPESNKITRGVVLVGQGIPRGAGSITFEDLKKSFRLVQEDKSASLEEEAGKTAISSQSWFPKLWDQLQDIRKLRDPKAQAHEFPYKSKRQKFYIVQLVKGLKLNDPRLDQKWRKKLLIDMCNYILEKEKKLEWKDYLVLKRMINGFMEAHFAWEVGYSGSTISSIEQGREKMNKNLWKAILGHRIFQRDTFAKRFENGEILTPDVWDVWMAEYNAINEALDTGETYHPDQSGGMPEQGVKALQDRKILVVGDFSDIHELPERLKSEGAAVYVVRDMRDMRDMDGIMALLREQQPMDLVAIDARMYPGKGMMIIRKVREAFLRAEFPPIRMMLRTYRLSKSQIDEAEESHVKVVYLRSGDFVENIKQFISSTVKGVDEAMRGNSEDRELLRIFSERILAILNGDKSGQDAFKEQIVSLKGVEFVSLKEIGFVKQIGLKVERSLYEPRRREEYNRFNRVFYQQYRIGDFNAGWLYDQLGLEGIIDFPTFYARALFLQFFSDHKSIGFQIPRGYWGKVLPKDPVEMLKKRPGPIEYQAVFISKAIDEAEKFLAKNNQKWTHPNKIVVVPAIPGEKMTIGIILAGDVVIIEESLFNKHKNEKEEFAWLAKLLVYVLPKGLSYESRKVLEFEYASSQEVFGEAQITSYLGLNYFSQYARIRSEISAPVGKQTEDTIRTRIKEALWPIAVSHLNGDISKVQAEEAIRNIKVSDIIAGLGLDRAMMTKNGGIDLTPANMNLQLKNGGGGGIKFKIDPAMLQQLQNAPGFTPVIINIQPLKSLPEFLEIASSSSAPRNDT